MIGSGTGEGFMEDLRDVSPPLARDGRRDEAMDAEGTKKLLVVEAYVAEDATDGDRVRWEIREGSGADGREEARGRLPPGLDESVENRVVGDFAPCS